LSAKDLIIKPIDRNEANNFVRKIHYSGKVAPNSQLHLGIFWNGRLEGVMQFGPSIDKRKTQRLVEGTLWNGFLELNRMAFSEALPKNSESRAIAVAMKLIRKHAPQVKWVISFADATQCGDGTIYRASGFVLTGIRRNTSIWEAPSGATYSRVSLTDGKSHTEQANTRREVFSRTSLTKADCPKQHAAAQRAAGGGNLAMSGGGASMRDFKDAGFRPIEGFQLRYLYFVDPTARARLTVPVLPFTEIDRLGARMYKGQASRPGPSTRDGTPDAVGGATPTPALP